MDSQPAQNLPAVVTAHRFVRTYYVRGKAPSFWRATNDITSPPTSGYGHAVIVPGPKRSVVFCPFTLQAFDVRNICCEVAQAKDVEISNERLGSLIEQSWEECVKYGLQRDYGFAAMVLTMLGHPVPKFLPAPVEHREGFEPKRHGKPLVEAELKPVDPSSKRGQVAAFFHKADPQSLHEAMARLEMSRSGVLSHLYTLNQVHGVGYELVSDCARLLLPDGFDLFAWVAPERKVQVAPTDENGEPREVKKRSAGKPVLPDKLAPIPEPSKRAVVAKMFQAGWYPIADAMALLDLDRSAVLSHLFTIHKENGLGYELSEDRVSAKLIIPEGHVMFCAKQPRVRKATGE